MLESVQLTNFRNYSNKTIKFSNPTTIITGRNAIGKTNILESIYVGLFTKSFRAHNDQLIINNSDFLRVELSFFKNQIVYYYTTNPNRKKTIKHNSKLVTLKQSIGKYPVVLFEPNSILLFSLSPSIRRKYLDTLLYQLDPTYIQNSIIYNKTLRQRNALLKQYKKSSILPKLTEQVTIYNIQLAMSGSYITRKRSDFLTQITPLLQDSYNKVSSDKKTIQTQFLSSNNSEEDLLEKIENNWQLDSSVGLTLIGPHREDFVVLFNDEPVKNFASRGEIRSLLLAFKFAELSLFSQSKQPPILLLDDVFSELDETRQKLLIKNTSGYQTIITSTNIPGDIIKDFQHIQLVN